MSKYTSLNRNTHVFIALAAFCAVILSACAPGDYVLGDFAWKDVNNNGIQDEGETGLKNVSVILLNADGEHIAETKTDADGKYGFTDVAGGDYMLEFDPPADYGFSMKDQGTDDSLDSDADPATGRTVIFTLAEGTANFYFDTGFVQRIASADPTPTATIEPVETPEDGDDEEEPPAEGVEIIRKEDPEGDTQTCETESEPMEGEEADIEKMVVFESETQWTVMAFFKKGSPLDYKLGIELTLMDLYSASYGFGRHGDYEEPFKWDSNNNYELAPGESVERVETEDGGVIVIAVINKPAGDAELMQVQAFSYVMTNDNNWVCDDLKYVLP